MSLASRFAVLTGLVLLMITGWIYAPGVHGPAMLDDTSSVINLNIVSEDSAHAWDQVFGDVSGPLGRPVSVATFVAERYFFQGSIKLSKTVNVVLHLMVGAILAWLLALLSAVAGYRHPLCLAVLGASVWLIAPLYVSTVLYAVQRMAILAALFMLLTMIVYVYWRRFFLCGRLHWPLLILGSCFLLLGIYSKENAIVVIPVLLLMELLWFGSSSEVDARGRVLRLFAIYSLVLGATLTVLVIAFAGDTVIGGYRHRDFSLAERLLSQTRILWDYVGQFYWPDVPRMGLYHDDVEVSKSLFEPLSTAYALAAWFCVFLVLLGGIRTLIGHRIAFAVSVYLVGHGVESTFLPLELYYEHRNYFPGIGLALLPVIAIGELSLRWRGVQAPLLGWLGLAILALALKTSSQVQIWSSGPLLRLNHVVFHPQSLRANTDMAAMLAELGELDGALVYSRRANEVGDELAGDHFIRNLALSCVAGKSLPDNLAPGPEALLGNTPVGSLPNLHWLINKLRSTGCQSVDRLAIAELFRAVYLDQDSTVTAVSDVYTLLAMLENDLERYDVAHEYNSKVLERTPDSPRALLMQLHFATALGKTQEVEGLKLRLLLLQEHSKLTFADRQTLALYLEQSD